MPIALWCVLIAGLLPYIAASVAKGRSGDFDNANPRDWLAKQEGFRKRANAAQSNGFETSPFFAVAVVVAMAINHAPQHKVDLFAIGFVIARLAYLGFYLANLASLRSTAWSIGAICTVTLFFV